MALEKPRKLRGFFPTLWPPRLTMLTLQVKKVAVLMAAATR